MPIPLPIVTPSRPRIPYSMMGRGFRSRALFLAAVDVQVASPERRLFPVSAVQAETRGQHLPMNNPLKLGRCQSSANVGYRVSRDGRAGRPHPPEPERSGGQSNFPKAAIRSARSTPRIERQRPGRERGRRIDDAPRDDRPARQGGTRRDTETQLHAPIDGCLGVIGLPRRHKARAPQPTSPARL